MRKAEKLFDDLQEWQEETFPDQTAVGKANHLVAEANELVEAITKYLCSPTDENYNELKMEFADVFLLTQSCAGKLGFNFDDLVNFGIEKLDKCKLKEWSNLNENGYPHHK